MPGRQRQYGHALWRRTAFVLVLWGCSGGIERGLETGAGGTGGASTTSVAGGSGGPANGVGGSGGASGGAGRPAAEPLACAPRMPQRFVLLSDLQHANSVSSVLGVSARDPARTLSADTKPFSQKGLVVSTSLVHDRLDQAEFAAASLDTRFTEVTGCPMTGDAACARSFLERFTAQGFRRPVASAEIDDLMAVFEVGAQTDYVTGVKLAVQAVLSAPSFTYRSEVGEVDATGAARLTAHELASELSFMLTDAPPDDELYAAAQSGALASSDELAWQVERLIALPAVQESLTKTLMAAWQIGNLFGTVKDPGLFPEYSPALQSSMYRETDAFVQAVLWTRGAPVSELLSSRESFVDGPLAEIYGVTFPGADPTQLTPVTLPAERSGLLTQASLLTMLSRTDNTSVVARGLFVRGALLCLPKIGAPPTSLAGQIMELLEADMTERERAEVRGMTSPCNSCHAGFDAFGLLLESYDPLGRYRTQLEGAPIDSSASLDGIGGFMGTYPDAVSFAQAAASAPEFTACLTRNLIAYGTGDDALATADCQVEDVVAQLPPAPTMRDLVRAATASPGLVHRSVEVSP